MFLLPLCSTAGIILLISATFWRTMCHTRTKWHCFCDDQCVLLNNPYTEFHQTLFDIGRWNPGAWADVLPAGSLGKGPCVFLGCYVKWSWWHLLFWISFSRAVYCQWKFPEDTYWSFTVITEPRHNNLWAWRDGSCQRWKKGNLQLNIEHSEHSGGCF